MNQSAAFAYASNSSIALTGPVLLVAVVVTATTGAVSVTINTNTSDDVMHIEAAAGTTVTFCPASPISLPGGLSATADENTRLTVVYC